MGLQHKYVPAASDDPDYEVSANRWKEDHKLTSRTVTGNFTLAAGDDLAFIYVNSASGVTCTMPNDLPADFSTTIIQQAAGQVTFTAGSGATGPRNRQSHTKTAGQYAVAGVLVASNAGGTAADYYLFGDTAA